MSTCLIYPQALSDFSLSASKRMFQVVPVSVKVLSDKRIHGTHWHDYLQIWYTVSGSYLLTVEGVAYEQKPGSAMLIFPYTKHSIDSSKSNMADTTVVQINVRKGALEDNSIPFLSHTFDNASFDFIRLDSYILFSGKDKEAADKICMELLMEFHKHASMQFSKLYSLIADFLGLCVSRPEKRYSKREIVTAKYRNACIDAALIYLMDNRKNRITITDASNAAMMSKTVFTTSFQTVTGQSCHSYYNMLRIHSAIDLLRYSDKSISEIAQECGYYDNSHFRWQCVEIYGASPLDLRKDLSQWTREYGDKLFQRTVRNSSWAMPFGDDVWERHRCAMSFY